MVNVKNAFGMRILISIGKIKICLAQIHQEKQYEKKTVTTTEYITTKSDGSVEIHRDIESVSESKTHVST